MANDLVTFLRARFDEDEGQARRASEDAGLNWDEPASGLVQTANDLYPLSDSRVSRHIVRHDPTRVLAEVVAKRAMIDAYESRSEVSSDPCESCWAQGLGEGLRLLAGAYDVHPDYRPEWASGPQFV